MTHPLIRVHTDAVLAVVAAHRDADPNLSFEIGDGAAPDGASTPYAVLHHLPSGPLDGSLGAPDADGSLLYQWSSWGATREQAEGLSDVIRTAMLDDPITVAGRVVMRVSVDSVAGVFRDDDLGEAPPLWHAPDRYRLHTTPA